MLLISCSDNRRPDGPIDEVSLVRDNIYKSTYSSSWSVPTAQNGSAEQAVEFCNNQGKQFIFRSSGLNKEFFNAQAYVYFSCVDFFDNSSTANALREKQRSFEEGQRFKAQLMSIHNQSINEKKRIESQERLRKREIEALENIQYNLRKLNDCRTVGGRIRCD
jgi:hypothetical protein